MFATVNIADSQHAQALSETAARDSNAMKQVCDPMSFIVCFDIDIDLDCLVSDQA